MDIAITGDMGIGNTTASAGLICALTGLDPEQVVGRGTGLDDAGLERKVSAVREALRVNASSIAKSPLDTLAALGGLEIAGLVRSEEHTSELQSQSNLVCRLLLEKKKQQTRSRAILTT